jgi:hypothetical protein
MYQPGLGRPVVRHDQGRFRFGHIQLPDKASNRYNFG